MVYVKKVQNVPKRHAWEASYFCLLYIFMSTGCWKTPHFEGYLPFLIHIYIYLVSGFPWSMVCFAGSISVACVFIMDFCCTTNSPKEKSRNPPWFLSKQFKQPSHLRGDHGHENRTENETTCIGERQEKPSQGGWQLAKSEVWALRYLSAAGPAKHPIKNIASRCPSLKRRISWHRCFSSFGIKNTRKTRVKL